MTNKTDELYQEELLYEIKGLRSAYESIDRESIIRINKVVDQFRGEKGDEGIGIESIDSEVLETKAIITFNKTDGSTHKLEIERLKGAKGDKGEVGEKGSTGEPGRDGIPGTKGIDGKPGIAGKAGVAGKDGQGFNWRGLWNSSLNYKPYDVVQYLGSSYVCTRDNRGSFPNIQDWQLMAQKGEDGRNGRNAVSGESSGGGGGGGGTGAVDSVAGKTGVVTLVKGDVGLGNVDNTSDANKPVSTAQQTALDGKANTSHTHTASNVTDFSTATDARISAASGSTIASLVGGLIPTSQIPSQALTTVQTAASQAAMLALTTQAGDIVVRSDQHKSYMHNGGTAGTMADFTLLDTPSDAVTSVNSQTGTVVLGKNDVGLGSVDNTSDASKPVSTAQQTALNLKADTTALTTHTSDTANPHVVTKAQVGLGSVDNTSDASKPVSTATQTALNLKANLASPTFTGTVGLPSGQVLTSPSITTPTGIVKGDVGLGNVDNTSNATERAAVRTLTNARLTRRVGTTTSAANPAINTDVTDIYVITAQAVTLTSFTTNLTGTPTDGQILHIAITDNGTTRTIGWGASFETSTVALPAATVASTRIDVLLVWNAVTSKWRCLAVA